MSGEAREYSVGEPCNHVGHGFEFAVWGFLTHALLPTSGVAASDALQLVNQADGFGITPVFLSLQKCAGESVVDHANLYPRLGMA